ncbi:MAG: murein biosynthesis integral membrane protein MurJ, partial [Myxococcota bacterium]
MSTETPPARSGSLAVAVGILASRLFGLVRQRVFAHYFGTSPYADVFNVGLRLPNLLQNLLGEGTLSASFIPVYAELLARGRKDEAGRVAGAVFALLLAIASALAIAGVLLAPIGVRVIAPGFTGERYTLTVTVVRWLFPMTGLLVLSAWALGIQNSHRRFLGSYLAPVAWNAAIIAAMVACGGWLGWRDADLLVAVSIGALIGGALQFLVQVPTVWALERDLKVRWAPTLPGVQEVVRNAGPAVLGRGVVQLSGYLDVFLASLLAPGAVAAIGYAQMLYLLPISLFGMSVAAAELPELARERAVGLAVVAGRARSALDRVAFLVVPSAVAFVALGDVAVAGVLRTGAFGSDQVALVHLTLAAYAVGLVASTGSRVLSSAFYAVRDTRTPARIAAVRVGSSAVLGVGMMAQLEPIAAVGWDGGPLSYLRAGSLSLGAVGLALGTGIGAW